MREILFRGIRKDTHEWIYGFYGEYFDGKKNVPCISVVDNRVITGSLCYEVIPETVGQYTGLTDKNGKKIFEGDICSTNLKRPYTVVAFRGGCFEYELDDGDGIYYDIMMPVTKKPATQDKYTIVIGNIHDNADLLGENNAKEQ